MKKSILISILILLIGCEDTTTKTSNFNIVEENTTTVYTSEKNITTTPYISEESVTIIPYFSKTSGSYYSDGIDKLIIKDINSSTNSIYLAMYDFTNRYIKDALIDAFNRGVDVKIVTDDETVDEEAYIDLMNAGIEVVNDEDSNKLMHNKFMVVDGSIVWSGSGNYTVYAFYRNYENYLRVKNQQIASIYKKEFFNLYNHNTKDYDGGDVKYISIYFSPDSDFEEEIIRLINNSQNSIYFLAFAFTNDKIADALIEAKNRGVEIKGVFDKDQNDFQAGSEYNKLLENGIEAKLSENKLHSKVFIFDSHIVITGSYNFTRSANDKNNENSLVIDDQNITNAYIDNFFSIYKDCSKNNLK